MVYIRTKDNNIYKLSNGSDFEKTKETYVWCFDKSSGFNFKVDVKNILKQADTIEELCDEFDIIVPAGIYRFGIYHARYEGWGDFKRAWRDFKEKHGDDYRHYEILGAYGAIWTNRGLIYVAKMNDKGELELL